jgi:hypothetical protein
MDPSFVLIDEPIFNEPLNEEGFGHVLANHTDTEDDFTPDAND